MAHLAFKVFVRGVIMIFIGNILWIITEESCSSSNGWKSFPGVMFYNLCTFYGYSMITIYIVYLHNDLKRNICYFQSMNQRNLCIGFIWFHFLFPSIKTSRRLTSNLHNQNIHKTTIDEDEEDDDRPTMAQASTN